MDRKVIALQGDKLPVCLLKPKMAGPCLHHARSTLLKTDPTWSVELRPGRVTGWSVLKSDFCPQKENQPSEPVQPVTQLTP